MITPADMAIGAIVAFIGVNYITALCLFICDHWCLNAGGMDHPTRLRDELLPFLVVNVGPLICLITAPIYVRRM
jgi:hypothetical protein